MTGDFRLLLFGQTASQLGAQVSAIAIPLLAVLTLHASPLQLGLLTASGTLAFAVIGLPAGAWIDRHRRRPILIAADLARTALLASIPLAAILGVPSIGHLIVVSLLAGVARVFFDIGYQSYLPTVVGTRALVEGNSAMEAIRATGQVAGPGLGGWLVTLIGAANVVLVQACAFAVSAISLLTIRTNEPDAPPRQARPGLWLEIRAGVRFLAGHRLLRATALTSTAGNVAFAIASAVNVVFLVRDVRLSPTALGGLLALGSVAAMAGAALTPRLTRRFGESTLVWLALAVTGPIALLGAFARPGWAAVLSVAGIAAGEFGQVVYAITSVSLRQRLCPEHLLGRVNATVRFATMTPFPVGAMLGGVLGELIGPRLTLLAAGVVVALSPVPVYLAWRADGRGPRLPRVQSWHGQWWPRGSRRAPGGGRGDRAGGG
ncbi:MFS transporter [Flindersiella endophytica]